ncbi:hypothetical protein D3C80_1641760 [compost metagenome]
MRAIAVVWVMLRSMIFDIVRRPVLPHRLIEKAATSEAAHPGEGRDPDHMTEAPAYYGAMVSLAVSNASYNLDPGLRRDERVKRDPASDRSTLVRRRGA